VALLLTGPPGVGKTSVLRAVSQQLAGFQLVGFYTEEIRVGRERRGFRLITFSGDDAVVAHVDLPPPRVAKYGVDVPAIDRFAAALRERPDRSAVWMIDEIGKMECLSQAFVDAVRRLLDSGRPLVATVAQRGGGFMDEVKRRRDVEVWTVTRGTRDTLPAKIAAWLEGAGTRS
jgi:nucleoside-triphosphatase